MPRLNDPRIAAATAPLPDGAPDPAEFRYDAEFEALDAEIRKLEREGPAGMQWPEMARQGEAILANRSKDLSVAAWLALSLAQAEGVSGLAVGLAILRDLIAESWDGLFPPKARARARVGTVEWLAGRAARTLPESPLPADRAEAVIAALEELQAIDQALVEHVPPDGASLGDLLRPLRALAQEARQLQVAAAPPPAPTEPPSDGPSVAQATPPPASPAATSAVANPPAAPRPPVTPQPIVPPPAAEIPDPKASPDRALSALRDTVRGTAIALLEANLAEPRGYALLRSVTWLAITDPPPVASGRTGIMPPSEQREAEFAALRGARNLAELVLSLERYCSGSAIFWLDGQRQSAMALAELGPQYAPCVAGVIQGVAGLLARLPTLPTLSFSDGRPFADAGTRAWIEAVVLPRPSDAAPAESGAAEPWRAAFTDARAALLDGKAEDGLAALVAGGRGGASDRDRFFWQLAQARYCIEAGIPAVALSILRRLEQAIDGHGLEAWEPTAAAEATKLLFDCLSVPEVGRILNEADRAAAADAAFARLARLDPVAAGRVAKANV